jgi:hypothetical protein
MKKSSRLSLAVVNDQSHNAKRDTGGEGKNGNPLTKVKADERSAYSE